MCEPEKHRLFHACYFGKIKSGPIANLSVTTRFAVFYSTLAYETSKTIGSNDKCVFSKTALYALFTELATEYKAENGMFSTTLSDFQSYHELFIIIDVRFTIVIYSKFIRVCISENAPRFSIRLQRFP